MLHLPDYDTFARLRLTDFLPAEKIDVCDDWRYLGHVWVAETDVWTGFFRLSTDPDRVRAITLDLAELPASTAARMLGALGIPLQAGMRLDEVVSILGQPVETHRFVEDRLSHEFVIGPPRYTTSCTIHDREGLIYFTMQSELPPAPND